MTQHFGSRSIARGALGAVALLAALPALAATAKPTVKLTASTATVSLGASTTLTWSSTGATSCVASGAWSGTQALNGSASTGVLVAAGTYTLTCTGTGGVSSASASVAVTPTLAQLTATTAALQSTVAAQATELGKLSSGVTAADLVGTYKLLILQYELDAATAGTSVGVRNSVFTGATVTLSANGNFTVSGTPLENAYAITTGTDKLTRVTNAPAPGITAGTWSLSSATLSLVPTGATSAIPLLVGLGGRYLTGPFVHPGSASGEQSGLVTIFTAVRVE